MGILELKNKVLQQVQNADQKLLNQLSDFIDCNLENTTIKEVLKISENEFLEGKTEEYENILKVSKEKYFLK